MKCSDLLNAYLKHLPAGIVLSQQQVVRNLRKAIRFYAGYATLTHAPSAFELALQEGETDETILAALDVHSPVTSEDDLDLGHENAGEGENPDNNDPDVGTDPDDGTDPDASDPANPDPDGGGDGTVPVTSPDPDNDPVSAFSVEGVDPLAPVVDPVVPVTLSQDFELTHSEYAIIRPLFELYNEHENAMSLEASRAQGIEVFGRSTAEVAMDIKEKEADMPKLAFVEPVITI